MYRYDPETEDFSLIAPLDGGDFTPYDVAIDSSGTIWVMMLQGGVLQLDPDTGDTFMLPKGDLGQVDGGLTVVPEPPGGLMQLAAVGALALLRKRRLVG